MLSLGCFSYFTPTNHRVMSNLVRMFFVCLFIKVSESSSTGHIAESKGKCCTDNF